MDVGWVADKDGRRNDGDPSIAADNLGGVLVDRVGVVVGAKFQVVGLAGCRRDLLSQTGVSGAELPDDHEDAEDDEDEHEPTESQDSGPVRGHIAGDELELLANGRDEIIVNPKERTPNHTFADDVKISFPSPAQPVGIEHLGSPIISLRQISTTVIRFRISLEFCFKTESIDRVSHLQIYSWAYDYPDRHGLTSPKYW